MDSSELILHCVHIHVHISSNIYCRKVVTHGIISKRIIVYFLFGTTATATAGGSTVHSKPEDKKDAAEHLIGIP